MPANDNTMSDFELPTEWDHMPTLKELSKWVGFLPGVDYCWVLVQNMTKARKMGWSMIQLSSPTKGLIGQIPPIDVKGRQIFLMAKGKPIPGMAPGTAGVVFQIDPELDDLLNAEKAPPVKLQPAPATKQAAAR